MARTVTVLSQRGLVCDRCELADSVWTRLRGLTGRARLEPGDGLMLRPASAIHTSLPSKVARSTVCQRLGPSAP